MNEDPPAYTPAPIDTSGVTLTEDIVALTELLACNAHEVWARGRMAEGWHYGAKRDDLHREHPSLVPYDQLSESEKEYDRATAMQTLRAIISLGYRITKSGK